MRPYLIAAHDYRRTSAGIRALHLLCHHLNMMGCKAWVTGCTTNPELQTPVATSLTMEWLAKDGITIYPEVEDGNPLGARHVVRYLLNIPNRIRKADFTPGEMMWAYCRLLRPWVPSDDRILYIPVVDQAVFKPRPVAMRNALRLVWVGKGAGGQRVPQTENALEITFDWPATAEELALMFQTSRRFYSYANYTAMIIESRLCGCPTVVIPNGLWTHGQFATGTPGGVAGLAWGTSKKELRWARRTVDGFRYGYRDLVRGFDEQLERFVQQTQEEWDNG